MNQGNQKIGVSTFALGNLFFLPLVGVVFGAMGIAWGTFTRKPGRRTLAQIATAGTIFAATISIGVYYVAFVQRGDVYDRLRIAVAQGQLNGLISEIELYRDQTGHYPVSLEELYKTMPRNSDVYAHDPTDLNPMLRRRSFHYERLGSDHYVLRSDGLDGKPFTADDIVPQVDPASSTRFGLLLRSPAQTLDANAPPR